MTKPTLADLPPRYQEQVRAQLAGLTRPKTVALADSSPVAPTMRQARASTLNKLETAFLAYLRDTHGACGVLVQAITLKIANGCRYTPDFIEVLGDELGHNWLVAYEVKGFMRDDAAVKLKVAARAFPFIEFNLATRSAGKWRIERVQP